MYNVDLHSDGDRGHRPMSDTRGTGPALVAVGIGGRVEVVDEQIMLIKGGVFGHAVELLWLGYGVSLKSIPISDITSVEIVKPLFLPDFIRFSYPGSPSKTHNYIDDALAENALIMSWFDNRAFYEIKTLIDRWPHLPPVPAVPDIRGSGP